MFNCGLFFLDIKSLALTYGFLISTRVPSTAHTTLGKPEIKPCEKCKYLNNLNVP